MGQAHMRCWSEDDYYSSDASYLMERADSTVIKINEFQLCKKNQIQDQKIEMEMIVQTKIEDEDVLDDLDTLYFSVEIGELYERDKFKWTERQDFEGVKRKKLEFGFKMNHIKQVIKVEIQGSYISRQNKNEISQKSIFIGYFNFARCVRKSGIMINPHQVGLKYSEYIDVQVGLKEKYKFGGYRCITLNAFDTKGGDFIENPELSVIVVETSNNTIVTEIQKDLPLIHCPDGLFKRIEIGVNNYSPQLFMTQSFKVYFLKDSKDYSKVQMLNSSKPNILMPMSDMYTEYDLLNERLQNDLVAFGEFTANDLIENSVFQQDFLELEPSQNNQCQSINQRKQRSRKGTEVSSSVGPSDFDEDNTPEYKLPLFNPSKSQQIGLMTLKNIQCRKRTSFLDLVANQMLEIVPIMAIDFSMSNLTFDDRKCIHTVNEDNQNEYRDMIVAISKAFRQISPTSLFYGFGANSVMKKTEVSDLFVGTGDLLNPIVMTDHLEQAYYSCLKRVELNLPVHFSKVIDKSIEFANHSEKHFLSGEMNTKTTDFKHGLTYFVLYILNTGIIDDMNETIQQLTRVINLPLSIYIINLQNKNLRKDDIDASMLEEKCKFLFERGNRRFLKVMEYSDLGFQSSGHNEIIHKLTERIPFEIEQYFDSVAAHGTQIHIEQNQVRKGLDLVREVIRQKDQFLDSIQGEEGLTKENVSKLIEEFKLYEYSAESAQILLGLKKRVDRS